MNHAPLEFRRYTQFRWLVLMLRSRRITLLDPETWDDSNDSYFLSTYKKRRRYKSILALCFANTHETYHHWRIFAPGETGVCIQFKARALLSDLQRPGLRCGHVKYLTLKSIKGRRLRVDDLPFLKRWPYVGEEEYRVLYQSRTKKLTKLRMPFDLESILRINLSPWLSRAKGKAIRSEIRAIPGCERIKINHSTLIGNDDWKRLADEAQ